MRSAAKIKARIRITSFDWTRSRIQAPSSRREDSNNASTANRITLATHQQAVKPSPWGPRLRHSSVPNEYVSKHWGSSARISVTAKRHPSHFQVLQPRAASVQHVRYLSRSCFWLAGAVFQPRASAYLQSLLEYLTVHPGESFLPDQAMWNQTLDPRYHLCLSATSASALSALTRSHVLCPATSLTALPSPINFARPAPSLDTPAIQFGHVAITAVNFPEKQVHQLLNQQKRPKSAV